MTTVINTEKQKNPHLQKTADLEAAARSKFGGYFYLIGFVVTIYSSVELQQYNFINLAFLSLFLLATICRAIFIKQLLSADDDSLHIARQRFSLGYWLTAGFWLAFSFWVMFISRSFDVPAATLLLIGTALTYGGSAALTPNLKLLRQNTTIMTIPVVLGAPFLLGGIGWALGLLGLANYVFMLHNGKLQNQTFWRALEDNQKLKEQAKQLDDALKKAESASQAKADFLAAMSHEIRTPMNGVLGMIDVLSRSNLTEKQAQQVGIVKHSGEILLRIISDVLDYSNLSANKLSLINNPVSPRQVLDNLVFLFHSQAESAGLKLIAKIENNVPDVILSDEHRLQQILSNFISNALKFTEKGSITIELKSTKFFADSNEYQLRFSVVDTGVGITPEKQKSIFEAFTQTNRFDPNQRGTGLGLSISKSLVDLMGGQIHLKSEPGKGSTFAFEANFKIPGQQ